MALSKNGRRDGWTDWSTTAPHAEAEKDSLFHPAVYAPASGCGGVRVGSARRAIVERGFELAEERGVAFAITLQRMIEELRDLGAQIFSSENS